MHVNGLHKAGRRTEGGMVEIGSMAAVRATVSLAGMPR